MIPTLEQKLAWLKPVPAAAGDGASTRPLGLGDLDPRASGDADTDPGLALPSGRTGDGADRLAAQIVQGLEQCRGAAVLRHADQ